MKQIAIVVFGLVLGGCLVTRNQAEEVEEKKQLQGQVATLQKHKADQEMQIQNFEAQTRELNGKLEEIAHQQRLSDQKSTELLQRVSALDDKLKQYDAAFLALEQEVAGLKKEPASTPVAEGAKKSLFDEAEDLFNEKNYKKAISGFQKFRETSPRDKNVPLATLRIGQCFQELGMAKEARLFYEEVIERYPETKLAKTAQTRLSRLKK